MRGHRPRCVWRMLRQPSLRFMIHFRTSRWAVRLPEAEAGNPSRELFWPSDQVIRRDSFMSNLLKAHIGDESIMGSVEFKCSRTRRESCRGHRDDHEETVTTPT